MMIKDNTCIVVRWAKLAINGTETRTKQQSTILNSCRWVEGEQEQEPERVRVVK
jgi:hypothetical protein